MSNKGRRMVADRQQQAEKPVAQGITTCAAAGCPLLGTIRRENSRDALCPCHSRAAADGWPKATAVILRHEALWWLAREAQSAPAIDAIKADLAADLFRAAKASGVRFDDGQREEYRAAMERNASGRGCMPLRMAGSIVEAAITTEAVAAAGASETVVPIGERRMSKLETAIRGVAMHLSEAA